MDIKQGTQFNYGPMKYVVEKLAEEPFSQMGTEDNPAWFARMGNHCIVVTESTIKELINKAGASIPPLQ